MTTPSPHRLAHAPAADTPHGGGGRSWKAVGRQAVLLRLSAPHVPTAEAVSGALAPSGLTGTPRELEFDATGRSGPYRGATGQGSTT
ncbi:hypothetical protein [Actinacidiphila oryziradicis]|uniref:Uncharacterized protein n=1 Tax=Actinacidiphila oryziradicis TaxID=2571141 RepID=A0A4U0SII4_9ACTN|nr:hypothetical protein [Actinacidiphila oryziradicis]TKA09530.1 hypothetical protein FCI23_22055 [Actinacidiphila oryziradicis]